MAGRIHRETLKLANALGPVITDIRGIGIQMTNLRQESSNGVRQGTLKLMKRPRKKNKLEAGKRYVSARKIQRLSKVSLFFIFINSLSFFSVNLHLHLPWRSFT